MTPDAAAPSCRYYGTCGGCAAPARTPADYAEAKRGKVVDALARAGVAAEVGALVDAHGAGRRRATFHSRAEPDGGVVSGFMRARAHDIVDIYDCPLLAPELAEAPHIARAFAQSLKGLQKPLDVQVTATLGGLDVDLRGSGALGPAETRKTLALAEQFDLARLSNHGVALIARRPATVAFGPAQVVTPPGGFLQATQAGEDILARLAVQATEGLGRVADLFCGAGAFALRLAEAHSVYAADGDSTAIAALRGARSPRVEAVVRDLFRNPLGAEELARFDAVLFDPPRAGAEAQARQIAASDLRLALAISCNAETFARDARILADAGFVCEGATPIDQFRYSAHVEIFAAFRRKKPKRRKGLLG